MAARAIWKGVIRLGDGTVPVKLYSAVEDRNIHFRLLHEPDRVPVSQAMVHAGTGEVVPRERIRRGYEVEPGVFVVLDDEELEALEPEPSRDIEVLRFVPRGTLRHQWYRRPYYLGPDGRAGGYFALARALDRSGRDGVVRWVMRKKEYFGALRLEGEYLTLLALRSADEVVTAAALDTPSGRELESREVKLAEQLVEALEDEFEPAAFQNEYRERVRELIAAKARGEAVEVERPEPRKAAEKSLRDALEESVRTARQTRVA